MPIVHTHDHNLWVLKQEYHLQTQAKTKLKNNSQNHVTKRIYPWHKMDKVSFARRPISTTKQWWKQCQNEWQTIQECHLWINEQPCSRNVYTYGKSPAKTLPNYELITKLMMCCIKTYTHNNLPPVEISMHGIYECTCNQARFPYEMHRSPGKNSLEFPQ